MVDIVATPEWKSVRILERDEVALGGYGGNMNEQATALVARTELLNREKADRSDIVQGQYSFSTLADFNAVKATLPPNSVVIIDEDGANQGTNTWNGTTLTKSIYDPVETAVSIINERDFSRSTSKNLYNWETDIHEGYFVRDDKIAYLGEGFGMSILYPVVEGETYTISVSSVDFRFFQLAVGFFATNKLLNNIPINVDRSYSSVTITVPEGAEYLAFNVANANHSEDYIDIYKHIQFEKGSVATNYTDYGVLDDAYLPTSFIKDLAAEVVDEHDFKRNISKNLYNWETDVIEGHFIRTTGISNFGDGFKMSTFYPVVEGETYTISISSVDFKNFVLGVGVFATNKLTSNPPINLSSSTASVTVTVPEGAKYLAFNTANANYQEIYRDSFKHIQFEKGSIATSYADYGVLDPTYLPASFIKDLAAEAVDDPSRLRPYETIYTSPNIFNPDTMYRKGWYTSSDRKTVVRSSSLEDTWAAIAVPVQDNETYTYQSNMRYMRGILFLENEDDATGFGYIDIPTGTRQITFQVPDNANYMVSTVKNGAVNPDEDDVALKIQIEKGTQATAITPIGVHRMLKPSAVKAALTPEDIISSTATLDISGNNISVQGVTYEGNKVEMRATIGKTLVGDFNSRALFNLTGSFVDGVAFTTAGDDIAPYYIADSIVGANHGLSKLMVTAAAHGKTTDDVGSKWLSDTGKELALLGVTGVNTLLFISADNKPTVTSKLSHLSGATNTGDITVDSKSTGQLYPSHKNRSISLQVDGVSTVIADGKINYNDNVTFLESYELMTMQGVYDFVTSNIGTQSEVIVAPAVAKVMLAYRFDIEGGLSFVNELIITDATTFYQASMLQSALAPASNGAVIYYIPKTKPYLETNGVTHDFSKGVDIRADVGTVDRIGITRTALEDASKPADRAYQMNNVAVFATGFIPVFDAEPQRRLALVEPDGRFWSVRGNTLKTYPSITMNSDGYVPVDAGFKVTCLAFKKFLAKNDDYIAYPVRTVTGDYFYIDTKKQGVVEINLPDDFKNKAYEIVEKSDNVSFLSEVTNETIIVLNGSVDASQYVYALIKIK